LGLIELSSIYEVRLVYFSSSLVYRSYKECMYLNYRKLVPSCLQNILCKGLRKFPLNVVQGVMKHLHLTSRELEEYEAEIEKVMKRYVKRLQWLMSGKLG
jgi:hypothetical protein